jgi:hypothetical protein
LAYIFSPGHTPLTFDYNHNHNLDAYRVFYERKSKETALYIKKIVGFLKENDPEGILYVFGDHGPWLSRRTKFEDDSTFYIQDRYAVYGGIYPSDRCKDTFAKPYTDDFMTVAQGAHMLLKCLSGGEDAFHILEDYKLPDSRDKLENRYESFRYE